MKDELFSELMESVREGGAILRGEAAPSRAFEVEVPGVKKIREAHDLSQAEFRGIAGHQRRQRPELGAGPYSLRNATIGSIRVALRAGSEPAASATPPSSTQVPASAHGSAGERP